jgi:single-strand DNA-binding protein
MSYQEIIIVGNLGREPEMHYTPTGQAVTSFPIAANRRYRDSQGELVKETTWFKITTWGRQAENSNEFLRKGSQVMIKGRLTPDPESGGPRLWERRDGTLTASYEVNAREIIFLGGREADNGQENGSDNHPTIHNNLIDNDIPF